MSDLTNLDGGSTVAGCCTTGSCGHADGAGEIERLRRWKEHASDVILRWDRLADGVPCPLGGRRSDAVADEIERLRAEVSRLRAAGDALAVAYRTLGGLDVAYDRALVNWEARRER